MDGYLFNIPRSIERFLVCLDVINRGLQRVKLVAVLLFFSAWRNIHAI